MLIQSSKNNRISRKL